MNMSLPFQLLVWIILPKFFMSRSNSLGKMLSEGSNGEAIENGVNIYKEVIGIFFLIYWN